MHPAHDKPSMSQIAAQDPVLRWALSARGRKLCAIEHAEVARQLPELFGRHFLQIGHWGEGGDWLAGSEMLHRAVLATTALGGGQARVQAERLPLASRSVDAILLPHTLEAAASPHTVLREVCRVLSDRGRLLILGFNPWSLLGLRRWVGLAPRAMPLSSHFYSAGRVSDWLKLLDFEISTLRRFSVGFPWLEARATGGVVTPASPLLPMAEAYLMVAKKRVAPLNLVGRSERAQVKPLIAVPVANAVRRDAEPDSPA